MFYQITYELKDANMDYSSLYLAIKKLGNWTHPLETVWYVESSLSLDEVAKALIVHVDPVKDKFLVSEAHVDSLMGRASTAFWDWIRRNKV